jgi:hypothetical protein
MELTVTCCRNFFIEAKSECMATSRMPSMFGDNPTTL